MALNRFESCRGRPGNSSRQMSQPRVDEFLPRSSIGRSVTTVVQVHLAVAADDLCPLFVGRPRRFAPELAVVVKEAQLPIGAITALEFPDVPTFFAFHESFKTKGPCPELAVSRRASRRRVATGRANQSWARPFVSELVLATLKASRTQSYRARTPVQRQPPRSVEPESPVFSRSGSRLISCWVCLLVTAIFSSRFCGWQRILPSTS